MSYDVQTPPQNLTARFAKWYEGPTSRDGAPLSVRPPLRVGGAGGANFGSAARLSFGCGPRQNFNS